MFLTVHDLAKLYGTTRSLAWCYRTLAVIRTAYNMDKPEQLLTVRQFCDYMQVDINEVYEHLGMVSHTGTTGKKAA